MTKQKCIQLLKICFPGSRYQDRVKMAKQFFGYTILLAVCLGLLGGCEQKHPEPSFPTGKYSFEDDDSYRRWFICGPRYGDECKVVGKEEYEKYLADVYGEKLWI